MTGDPATDLIDKATGTVDDFFAAYDAGDIDGMVELMTPGVLLDCEEGPDVEEE